MTTPEHDFPELDKNDWATWKDYVQLSSWWPIENRDKDEFHTNHYHGAWVPQIPQDMILRFTKPFDVVLDPMMGGGTSGIEATLMGRHFIGAELVPEVFENAAEVIQRAWKSIDGEIYGLENYLHLGDCRDLIESLEPESVNLTLFHPPYMGIIKFSEDPLCWSNLDYGRFMNQFMKVAHGVLAATVPDGHMCLVCGDIWDGETSSLRPLAFECMNQLRVAGWQLRSTMVKDFGHTRGKSKDTNLWRSRCLKAGTTTMDSEFVFVMRKPAGKKR